MKFELKPNNRNPQKSELIDDIKRIAKLLSKESITTNDYQQHGRWNVTTPIRFFGKWNNALEASGLNISKKMNTPETELFDNLKNIWLLKGRQPYSTEILKPFSKFDLSVYKKKFGSWRRALEAFVQNMQNENVEINSDLEILKTANNERIRNVNLRLRFFIMNRDNFKCVKCGRSPATDPQIILHIDHKIPWSKGGQTILENLQTLCSDCNLGKSDLFAL